MSASDVGVLVRLLSSSSAGNTRWTGALLVVAACACWGLDNNFTQRISLRDARRIVAIKGLVGGATNLVLAGMLGSSEPGTRRLCSPWP